MEHSAPSTTATVRTLFFARYRELLGSSEVEVSIPGPMTVSEFVELLRGRGEPFSLLPAEPAVAVNREVARRDSLVRSGDEVAFLPPVAGG
jgi:sulfur-carrier protein